MVLKTRRWLGVRGQDKNSGADAKSEDGAGVDVVQRDEHHLEYHDRVRGRFTQPKPNAWPKMPMLSDCDHGIPLSTSLN